MRRAFILTAVVLALVAAATTFVGVTRADNRAHYHATAMFPDFLCGFHGTTTFVTVDNFRLAPNGTHYDPGQLKQTFVADDGRGLVITWDAGLLIFYPPIVNADGTATQVAVTDGLDVKTQALNGPVLEQSTGRAQITFTFDASGNLTSITAVALAGAENNLTGMPDCSVVGPYLASA
jgi:YD repeat-containing protein